MDPLSEKYYSISPYAYCNNNPIKFIDPDGRDIYVFDEETGEYQTKWAREGTHRMAVTSKDKRGNLHIQFYDFADPDNDSQNIDKGNIKYFERFTEGDIDAILEQQGIFDMYASFANILWESPNGGKLDYTYNEKIGSPLIDYLSKKHPKSDVEQRATRSIYIVEGGIVDYKNVGYGAHNYRNFGNFLWGVSLQSMGVPHIMASIGAHGHNILFDRTGGQLLDSDDDQYSIKQGYRYAKKNGFLFKQK